MAHPYKTLPQRAYWRPAVGMPDPLEISELWQPKRNFLKGEKVSTFGSCFAQHFGQALQRHGYAWFDAEPAPKPLPAEDAKKFNYGVFSARTGNIYTAAMLSQWLDWALGQAEPPAEVWEHEGRFFDPFRPAIEPGGFASREELLATRAHTITSFRRAIEETDHFVFTMGLTEGWINSEHEYSYAMCPGTLAGEFDEARHRFVNWRYTEVARHMRQVLRRIAKVNSNIHVLLTVSPVPLTATASGSHVLPATTYSKSVLRAVAGDLAEDFDFVEYFPSYEIITAPVFGGRFFETNRRSVKPEGVEHVMKTFFAGLASAFGEAQDEVTVPTVDEMEPEGEDELVCEEQMLDAFSRR
ncbi:GSCFA domain-containing protein [Algicella marina]|uniref:GSCFA family protein n=1 Tax=Algicella marina TaxID=2683284 RepID=A0A6P1T2G9_9RHOB|nr:GSCFA domain-containing protein [Algicella marina]QHQ35666.1 GSCFA family protein [Algicella marina]